MSRKEKTTSETPTNPNLLYQRAEVRATLEEQLERGRAIRQMGINNEEHLEQSEQDSQRWIKYTEEYLKRAFTNESIASEFSAWHGGVMLVNPSFEELIQEFHETIDDKNNRLQSIIERLDLIPVEGIRTPPTVSTSSADASLMDVFIAHGHDEAARDSLARFITQLELNPIILDEKPSKGRTIIEKFEDHSTVGFAVVLLTPDDVGASSTTPENTSPRARQNVIFELGFFCGNLGRSHVCALRKGEVEQPSDYDGVIYIDMDQTEGWKFRLAKEMRAAGLPVDLNKCE